MIELYKMVTGKYSEDSCIKFNFVSREVNQTRGNEFKIFQEHVHYNLRKYYFSNRVIQIWNSLPDSVVESKSINSKATGNSRSGIPGNSRESATPKIPGGNSRELLSSR